MELQRIAANVHQLLDPLARECVVAVGSMEDAVIAICVLGLLGTIAGAHLEHAPRLRVVVLRERYVRCFDHYRLVVS